MKAVQLTDHHGIDAIKINDIPKPKPGQGQLLVAVKAVGVNPVDWKIAEGLGKDSFGHALPVTLGCDISGEIVELGQGVTSFNVGDAVLGYVNLQRCGGYAEFAIAEPGELARKPDGITHAQAAALPVASLTAYQALFNDGQLRAGQRVLIHAASGGVGSMAAQLAKAAGAHVFATASGKNKAFVESLGVDAFIDYRATDFTKELSDLDLVFDAVGGETQEKSFTILKPQGRLVSIVSPPSQALASQHQVHATFTAVVPDGAQLAKIAGDTAAGKLKVTIAKTFSLDQTIEALRESKAGRTVGKLIVTAAGLEVKGL